MMGRHDSQVTACRFTGGRVLLAALITSVLVAMPAAPAFAASLHVVPFPGTPDAAPASHVIFSSLRPSDLTGAPAVTGSSSGVHVGRLVSLPDQAGTAFIPAKPFIPGEKVFVSALLTSPGAARASGLLAGLTLRFSFHVGASPTSPAVAAPSAADTRSTPAGPFHSAPGLHPPPVALSTGPAPAAQNIFLSPDVWGRLPYQTGVMILNRRGRLVWFHPTGGDIAYNLEVQRYRGRPVLTWWQGQRWHNVSSNGQDVILSRSYRTIAVLHAAYGYSSDLHEFQITPRGTALIDAYVPVKANLTGVGGPANGKLNDSVIQELDVRTGAVLWEWHAWGHVPMGDSWLRPPATGLYDAFHVNSVQQLAHQRLLLSFRNTSAVYEIDERTGKVLWTLGGSHPSFRMGPGTRFAWQHDAHMYSHNLVTVFDDAASPQKEPQSSAKELELDTGRHRVTLVRKFTHTPPLLASVEGSAQLLGNGDVFVGWGDLPVFSEYSPQGHQVFNATLPLGVKTYRAYRFGWTGQPATRPALAPARSAKGRTWLYASWNGATQVATWRVLGGSATSLKPLKTAPWTGFETAIALPHPPRYLAVQALDGHGHVLGRSRTLMATAAAASASAGAGHGALHVIPFPGTPDAAPASHIIFSSLGPSDLAGKPSVTGSSSGPHSGRLVALPDHAGVAFVPAHPFTPGERVTVRAPLSSRRAGTASGAPGATSLDFSFGVAVAAPGQNGGPQPASSQPGPFHSQPSLNPPPLHVSAGPAPGRRDIFVSPRSITSPATRQAGLMILNPRGQLLWFHPVTPGRPYNLEVQRYRSHPVLTWWQGVLGTRTTSGGQDVILNTAYRPVAVLHAAYGYSSDLHEFQITPQGTALIDAYVPVRVNLSSVGGPPNGWLDDCVIQELDIHTGRVLWEWHALGHVPLSASQAGGTSGNPFVYFHLNSIQQLPGHRLLISARDTWSVYLIDELTGRTIWTLGGRYSSFRMGPGTRFEWQHDARLHGNGLLTLFDDAASPQKEAQSSAKELAVNTRTHGVSLVAKFTHSPPLVAGSEGSTQLLHSRDVFVGWGSEPDISEYGPGGRQVFNATFPLGIVSYRAYRFAWTGRPLTRPAVAVSRSAKGVTWVYVSWNGASGVARWRVLGGSRTALNPIRAAPWGGFETAIALPHAPRYLAVQALDAQGRPLGRSKLVTRPSG